MSGMGAVGAAGDWRPVGSRPLLPALGVHAVGEVPMVCGLVQRLLVLAGQVRLGAEPDLLDGAGERT
jgi:hypothetical protein